MPCVHHVKRPADCRLCRPCPHLRVKRHCRVCTPCPHGKLLANCSVCRGCVHGRVPRHCQQCRSDRQLLRPRPPTPDDDVVPSPPGASATPTREASRRQITGLQRQVLACRQKWACALCHSLLPAVFHVDHVKPLAHGGPHTVNNLQVLCPNCHAMKSALENSRAQGCDLFAGAVCVASGVIL
jgi:hypothetical protein